MTPRALLARLHQVTGSLAVAAGTPATELRRFERALVQHLQANPDLTITGNRLPLESAGAFREPVDVDADRLSAFADLFAQPALATSAMAAPLVFRRETAFRSALLGNSVAEWGAGMAPSATFGPFVDEHGRTFWFDFFNPLTLTSVSLAGASPPSLRLPISGTMTGRTSYRIEAGSAWVASDLIARVAALHGFYTGFTIRGGTLDLSQPASVSGGQIILGSGTRATLHLDVVQPAAPAAERTAGADAFAAVVQLPKTIDLQFTQTMSRLVAGDAAATMFGNATAFTRTAQAAIWAPLINQILVPFHAVSAGAAPDRFAVATSRSTLCAIDGQAPIDQPTTGWLLPAAKADPLALGIAAGAGALCVTAQPGLSAVWKDLKGGKTTLAHPSIIVEPGLLTVLDFTAGNPHGRQKWKLWRNVANAHASEIVLSFGPVFPFVFLSSAADSEGVYCFCAHTAAIDRPVDANGVPFAIHSSTAFAATLQTGAAFHAFLFDTDLALDTKVPGAEIAGGCSIALRNAFFKLSAPRSLLLMGDLVNSRITKGVLALTSDIHLYLPTLPDPYVASYTPYLRDPAALASAAASASTSAYGRPQQGLTAFVQWPNPSTLPNGAPDPDDPRALVHFRFTPLLPSSLEPSVTRTFHAGLSTFNQSFTPETVDGPAMISTAASIGRLAAGAPGQAQVLQDRVAHAERTGELGAAVAELAENPLLAHIADKTEHVNQVLEAALRSTQASEDGGFRSPNHPNSVLTAGDRGALGTDFLMLLDVSTRADQMGITLGPALQVERDERGNTMVRTADIPLRGTTIGSSSLPLQIMNMDVVTTAPHVRAATLPQVSWEPLFNIPLPIEGSVPADDTVTVTPGLLVYDNDGIPTRLFSASPHPVPIAPLPVTRHFLKEFNHAQTPRNIRSVFSLPFAMLAQADFNRSLASPDDRNARLDLHMPHFDQLRGGLQIKVQAPVSSTPESVSPSFPGRTVQLDNIRWGLFGTALTGGTLGKNVGEIFNQRFATGRPAVPLERVELSGYGASIFSNWRDADATVADVSQTQFDVLMGRAAHEVVQVRTFLYPFGVHVVRTITLMRSNNGYVFRSDSGWMPESTGFYDFSYTLNFGGDPPDLVKVLKPYEFHDQPVKGVTNVRNIRDFPDGGSYKSSFAANDPDLPADVLKLSTVQWKKLFAQYTGPTFPLDVHMEAVVFDADVHVDNVVSGGTNRGGDVIVQSRQMMGYVQLAPASIVLPAHVFADLLRFQKGSLGGPVDCIIDVAKSKQRMRVQRVDVNPAVNAAGKNVFVSAARGSLILPQDGSWSVVKQHTDTGDVQPVPEQEGVPLIKPNANPNFLLAHPADVYVPKSNTHYGVLQSTGTQKVLFDVPQFSPGEAKLKSAQTYFADAYKLLNSKGVFPNVANALGLTAAEREIDILDEGLMRMATPPIKLDTLLPANYIYPFVDEPGVLRIYAQYQTTDKETSATTSGELTLSLDSSAALEKRWKAALSNMRIVVDLGPFTEIMWVDGHFNAGSGIHPQYDKPHLQFGSVLEPVVEILQVLATLSGDDFDRGMSVGMSNSADNWEYKFNCSKEIPVIKFPSPSELTINPNPPMKLEAGLRVGFYFNEVLSVPTDLKQLVPACGAYVEFYGGLQVQCFTLGVASIYGVGHVTLGIAADSKAGITLHMKFGFGAEVVVGLPVVANVSVLYMVEVEVSIAADVLDVAGLLLFRGSAEICGGLVAICIQIEAGGNVHRENDVTSLIAQVTFSIDVCLLWVIDIDVTEHWEERRQIA